MFGLIALPALDDNTYHANVLLDCGIESVNDYAVFVSILGDYSSPRYTYQVNKVSGAQYQVYVRPNTGTALGTIYANTLLVRL